MTPTTAPDPELVRAYEEAAQRYLRSLRPEHFMEATDHARQREITLESFALVHAVRPEVQCFNELLVQYPRRRRKRFGQVVPDNFVVVHPEPIQARGSYDLSVQPVGPLLVLEYVSKYNERKDYDDNFDKYEGELRVPYYLLFYPDNQDLSVFRLADERYVSVRPNPAGRLAIPELELEVAILNGWARYWFRGELLPPPGELLRQRDTAQRALSAERAARQMAEDRATAAEAEIARLREELAKGKPAP